MEGENLSVARRSRWRAAGAGVIIASLAVLGASTVNSDRPATSAAAEGSVQVVSRHSTTTAQAPGDTQPILAPVTVPVLAAASLAAIAPASSDTEVAAEPEVVRRPMAVTPIEKGKARVAGTMVVGETVRAKVSHWPPRKTTFAYQWYAGKSKISGATKATLVVPASAAGKRLTVKVTASAPGYLSTSVRSAASLPVNRVKIDARCLTKGRVICADKNVRKVYQVQDGKILAAYDTRFGMAGLRTRNGVFELHYRSTNQYSEMYKVWMPYAQFFSGSQGVHYSADFAAHGYGIGSHGCVNLRDYEGAKKLYAWAELGDKVVVYGRDH